MKILGSFMGCDVYIDIDNIPDEAYGNRLGMEIRKQIYEKAKKWFNEKKDLTKSKK